MSVLPLPPGNREDTRVHAARIPWLTKWSPGLGMPTMFIVPPRHMLPQAATVMAGGTRLALEAEDVSGR